MLRALVTGIALRNVAELISGWTLRLLLTPTVFLPIKSGLARPCGFHHQ